LKRWSPSSKTLNASEASAHGLGLLIQFLMLIRMTQWRRNHRSGGARKRWRQVHLWFV